MSTLHAEIAAERERAHAKHGPTSMEGLPVHDPTRLAVLTEEVGEVAEQALMGTSVDRLNALHLQQRLGAVARALNETRHHMERGMSAEAAQVLERALLTALADISGVVSVWLAATPAPHAELRPELVQVAAMAEAWQDNLVRGPRRENHQRAVLLNVAPDPDAFHQAPVDGLLADQPILPCCRVRVVPGDRYQVATDPELATCDGTPGPRR